MTPTPAGPPTAAGLRLVRPALADVPAPVRLGADQRAVVDRVVAGADPALLVVGAAGTGKTLLAVEAVAAALGADDDGLFPSPDLPSPDEVLVLASGRRAAAELRDRIGARVRRTTGQAMVRTPAAAAFAVLRARASLLGDPAPTLISGPEQDLALAELLAGHAAGEGVPLRWPDGVPDEALTLRAFRGELRDLVMRAAERGVEPEDLALLGERHGRPEWVAAAALYQEYVDVTTLRAGTPDAGARYDPAVVVEEAAEVLRTWEDELPGPRPRWRLVVVDDYQEATEATARLLRVLQDDGARLLLLADPDAAVQTFRGATPALVGRADVAGTGPGELGATRLVLDGVRRHGPVLRGVAARVAERVAVVGGAAHRRALPVAVAGAGGVPTQAGEAAAGGADPARRRPPGRAAHRRAAQPGAGGRLGGARPAARAPGGRHPWAEMAVIARSGGQVTALRRALGSAQVPVAVVGSDVPLRDEPAVRPLLDALRVALGPDAGGSALDAELAARLCCSPLGGMDAVGLRRLRRSLRAEEVALGGGRASDELLVEVLLSPAQAAALQPVVRRPVARIATVLAEGRAAAAAPGADAQAVLWAIWDASGLAEPWRRSALAGGPGGARADRDLDAVLALFRAAETFVDRMPQARAAAFLEWVEAQELPSDTIAARARRDAVSVLTPAGAAGREWDVVAVAGVQEGVWPDLRLRDSLLGSQALVDVLAGRGAGRAAGTDAAAGDAHAVAEAGAAARAAVLADELRSFHVAVSRARRVLLVTAVSDEDDQPSPFLDLVEPNDEDDDPRRTVAPAPLDLRGLVAQLRGRLEQSAREGTPTPRPRRCSPASPTRASPVPTPPSGTAWPTRRATRRCGRRASGSRCRRRGSRPPAPARCAGPWRRRAARRRAAPASRSARSCTPSRRPTRGAAGTHCWPSWTGGGRSSGSGTAGPRRWSGGGRRPWSSGSRTTWSGPASRSRSRRGSSSSWTGPWSAGRWTGSSGRSRARVRPRWTVPATGRATARRCRSGSSTSRPGAPPRRRRRRPPTRSSAPTSSRWTPARSRA